MKHNTTGLSTWDSGVMGPNIFLVFSYNSDFLTNNEIATFSLESQVNALTTHRVENKTNKAQASRFCSTASQYTSVGRGGGGKASIETDHKHLAITVRMRAPPPPTENCCDGSSGSEDEQEYVRGYGYYERL